jgi:hypothetical protein
MSARRSSDRIAECLALAGVLALALLFAARAMIPALSPDVVQDDARQYTFWTGRLHDPQLFRDDLIADYYQSLVAPGFAALYWAMTWAVDPLSATKLLPPLLGLAAALFTFLFVRRLHSSPPAALLAAALLSWHAWQGTALASASPRAFGLPLLAAILWSLAARRRAGWGREYRVLRIFGRQRPAVRA